MILKSIICYLTLNFIMVVIRKDLHNTPIRKVVGFLLGIPIYITAHIMAYNELKKRKDETN